MLDKVCSKNPKHKIYQDMYICDSWKDSFKNFLQDMGERPKGTTLDRIDNSKGYFKENCRWSTSKEQANNRRDNVIIPFRGNKYTAMQLSELLNINHSSIRTWFKQGKDIEVEILRWEKDATRRDFPANILYKGKFYTQRELRKVLNIEQTLLSTWVRKGKDIEQALKDYKPKKATS